MSASAGLIIRRMNAADLDRVFEIALALPEAPHWSLSSYVAAIDPMHTPRRIALVSTDPDNDAPTGFVIASLLPPEAELETIAVAPSGQRQGVGSRLLSVLAEELRNEHVNQLILEVRASNLAALRFYRAYGFKQTGRRTRYYSDPEEDAVLMGLSLV